MKRLSKHCGMVGHLGELRFKKRLDGNPHEFLAQLGLKPGQVVLDFGCGSGRYTIPAARLVAEKGTVYALDVSQTALEQVKAKAAKECLGNIVLIRSPGEGTIPLEKGTVDHVLLIDALQEVQDRKGLLDEIHRVTKPNGALTIFPMHLKPEEVENLAIERGFSLKGREFQGRILAFTKGVSGQASGGTEDR